MRFSAVCLSSSLMRLRDTWRAMLPLMVASASLSRGAAMSLITTDMPASAQTWAMPLPIWPAPTIPILRMVSAMMSIRNRSAVVQRSALDLGQFGLKLGHCLIEVRDQAIIRDLEDRRLFVLIDSNNHLGVFHPGEMLNRTGNSDRDIEFRRHHLAGLADLPVVRRIAGVDRGARGANRGAELVRHRLDILGEVFAALHRAAARDDDLGRGQFRAVALRQLLPDERRNAGIGRR